MPLEAAAPPARGLTRLGLHAGREGLASLFLLGGINKLRNYADTLAQMEAEGLAPAALLLPLTIALELGGGLAVALGRRGAVPAALTIEAFTLAVNFVFHPS